MQLIGKKSDLVRNSLTYDVSPIITSDTHVQDGVPVTLKRGGITIGYGKRKGGCGGTASSSNIADILARYFGLRVIIGDMDIQGPGLKDVYRIKDHDGEAIDDLLKVCEIEKDGFAQYGNFRIISRIDPIYTRYVQNRDLSNEDISELNEIAHDLYLLENTHHYTKGNIRIDHQINDDIVNIDSNLYNAFINGSEELLVAALNSYGVLRNKLSLNGKSSYNEPSKIENNFRQALGLPRTNQNGSITLDRLLQSVKIPSNRKGVGINLLDYLQDLDVTGKLSALFAKDLDPDQKKTLGRVFPYLLKTILSYDEEGEKVIKILDVAAQGNDIEYWHYDHKEATDYLMTSTDVLSFAYADIGIIPFLHSPDFPTMIGKQKRFAEEYKQFIEKVGIPGPRKIGIVINRYPHDGFSGRRDIERAVSLLHAKIKSELELKNVKENATYILDFTYCGEVSRENALFDNYTPESHAKEKDLARAKESVVRAANYVAEEVGLQPFEKRLIKTNEIEKSESTITRHFEDRSERTIFPSENPRNVFSVPVRTQNIPNNPIREIHTPVVAQKMRRPEEKGLVRKIGKFLGF